MTTTKTKRSFETSPSNVPILLGLFSMMFAIVPFVGLALATAGTIIGVSAMRKFEYTKEGNRYMTYLPSSKITGATKVGTILSIIGVVIGAIVTVFGVFLLVAFLSNLDTLRVAP